MSRPPTNHVGIYNITHEREMPDIFCEFLRFFAQGDAWQKISRSPGKKRKTYFHNKTYSAPKNVFRVALRG
jgi:hypothetical protein